MFSSFPYFVSSAWVCLCLSHHLSPYRWEARTPMQSLMGLEATTEWLPDSSFFIWGHNLSCTHQPSLWSADASDHGKSIIRTCFPLLAPSESVKNLHWEFNFSTEGFKLIRGLHANKDPDTSINQSSIGGLRREDIYSLETSTPASLSGTQQKGAGVEQATVTGEPH